MPKQTFLSLEPEKQKRVMDAALAEFSENAFAKVTIDNIVGRAGIPKGSFYQYFTNKEDLYRHLFRIITEEKKDALESVLPLMEQYGFHEFMRRLYMKGADFNLQSQARMGLKEKFLNNCRAELREDILDLMMAESDELLETILRFYMDKKELRSGLNVPATARLITTLSTFISRGDKEPPGRDVLAERIETMLSVILFGIVNS